MEQTKHVVKTKKFFVRGSSNGYKSYALAFTRDELEALGLDFDQVKDYDLLVDSQKDLITIKVLNKE